jgi:hypothetical protein
MVPADEHRESTLGRGAHPRRTAQARLCRCSIKRREIHGQATWTAKPGMMHFFCITTRRIFARSPNQRLWTVRMIQSRSNVCARRNDEFKDGTTRHIRGRLQQPAAVSFDCRAEPSPLRARSSFRDPFCTQPSLRIQLHMHRSYVMRRLAAFALQLTFLRGTRLISGQRSPFHPCANESGASRQSRREATSSRHPASADRSIQREGPHPS